MKNIDYLTLKVFFEENIDFFIGARLQKIQQPTRKDFVFSLRNNGESRKLYININPEIYHICFMETPRTWIEFPKQPPMFCMLLRKYIEGCRIEDALVVENERIIEFHFETMDEFSQKRSLCLAIELMGKHSNVILYDRETNSIIGCAHNVGPEKSRYRELQGGLKYIYPPKVNSRDKVQTPLFEKLKSTDSATVNKLLDSYYSKFQEELILKEKKRKIYEITNGKLRKIKNSIEKISTLLKRRDKTDEYKHLGELLKANLYLKADYKASLEVFDYIENKNITIELDPNKTLSENAQRYFKLYTKSKTTKEKSAEILKGLNIEREYLENIIYSIEIATNLKDLEDIEFEEKKSVKKEKPEILKIQINGHDVYIGRNNKQNDFIISKLAKDEDYWFHTRLCAGSHILLKVNGVEPNEETLFECCKLARKYSSASQPSKVGVIYTRAKNLRKPPAAPLGYVTYKNEKEVLV